nr:MAG TPA: hypothetical protein [Caudoviricetes sp.]
MVSASRLATALLFHAVFAPVAHPNAERLTGAFLCERGHIKNDHLPAANSRRGHGGVYLSALYTNKKKKKNFPLWVLSALSASSALSALSVLSVSSAPYHIWYGGQQADNRQGALRICCPP